MQGYKVVTAEEMALIEKGGDPERYMQTAGRAVAGVAIAHIKRQNLSKKVTLLVGVGNNGGDAYAAGLWLLKEGFEVAAVSLPGELSPLNKKFREKFRKKQGKFTDTLQGLLIDGLLGTGFHGKLKPKFAALIQKANSSDFPIIAIDIPSGINGTTGENGGDAVIATETVTLGLPKIGLFIEKGWNCVGKLHVADFGLPKEAIAAATAVAYIPKRLELPKITRVRHKYQAGYVIGYAGSKMLPGAAKLAGIAALKVGAGIVRLFHPEEIGPVPFELICNEWSKEAWQEALQKCAAVFIGPGLGVKRAKEWIQTELKKIKRPCVIDADALLPDVSYPKGAILTPHRGEVLRLLKLKKAPKDEELFAKVIRFCTRHQLYLVLKGAPSFIFGPKHNPIIIPRGDPGMASAGMGDVLTGMIAGLLAQGVNPYEAAILGVSLHAMSGEIAANILTSYCLTASDLIDFMPAAFHDVLQGHDIV